MYVNDGTSLTYFGQNLDNVIAQQMSPAVSSGGGGGSWDWGGFTTGGSGFTAGGSQFIWLSSSGYAGGGGGSSSGGGGTGSSTPYLPALNYNWGAYSQWNLQAVANVFHDMGDSVNNFGIVVTGTGIGAEVGVPLMAFGGAISLIGTGIDLFVDMRDNTTQSFDYATWAITVGLEANSIVFGKFTTTTGEKIIFELSQNGIEYIKE